MIAATLDFDASAIPRIDPARSLWPDVRMPKRARHGWIDTVPPDQATGLLAKLYAAAFERVGRVFNVLRIQSLRPETLRISTLLYREVMYGERSPLSRAQREMLATAVSRANACEY